MLPEALRAWRIVRGEQESSRRPLSQKELSVRAQHHGGKVSPTLIAMIETGERQPSLTNALAIARALRVSLLAIATCTPEVAALIRKAEAGGEAAA